MIRKAEYDDISAIVGLFEEAAEKSDYAVKVDRLTARKIVVQCIASEHSGIGGNVIFVSDNDGVDGAFVGAMRRFYEVCDIYLASNLLWYARAESRAAWSLLAAFEDWSAGAGERVVLRVGVTDTITDPKRFEKAMARKGYRNSGLIFEREI